MDGTDSPRGVDDLALLTDDVRRRLYECTAGQAGVTRDEAAAAVGISRSLAAYHLDRLAESGMLDVDFARTNGRTGPGSGRPAKHYTRSEREVAVSFPPRNYSLLARVLASAASAAASDPFRAALSEAAHDEGRALADDARAITPALKTAGYEPCTADDGDIVLQNCPFHGIVQEHAELACGLNHAFVRGVLDGVGSDPKRAELAPAPGRCCVLVHAAESTPA